MEEEKVKALSEIQTPPLVIVTKPADSNHSSPSTSSADDDKENDYMGSHGSLLESHSENEFTKASSSPYQPPNDETREKIRNQVEFYMSEENLGKDAFLLKHVRRHKEGFVNLKLITSFKKVKNLTKDYRVVAESLRDSEVLVMNLESTKVRRKQPLPAELRERNPGRTILATQLGIAEPTIEKVAEIFSKFGPIAVVRIVRGGKNVPPECKAHFSIHPELNAEVCAIVEFETMAAAARACSDLSQNSEMRVTELVRGNKSPAKGRKDLNDNHTGDSDKAKDSEGGKTGKRRCRKKKNKNASKGDKRLEELVTKGSGDEGHTSSSDESAFTSFNSYRRRYNGSSDGQSPKPRRANQKVSPGVSSSSPMSSPEMRRRRSPGRSPDADNPGRSPVAQRRLAAQGQSPLAANADHRMVQTLGVVRQPKGPDGTRGFSGAGRGRIIGVGA